MPLPRGDEELGQTQVPTVGLDMGTFAVKGVLMEGDRIERVSLPTAGRPIESVRTCLERLLGEDHREESIRLGITGANAHLLARELGLVPVLEIEAMCTGLSVSETECDAVLSLGHENIYYLEIGPEGTVDFFNRNGQCAAGSGAFWYQQATRLGYDDEELAELALTSESPIRISGRCAVFAKSDMTHAINEGATQGAVSAGLAKTLAEMVIINVTQGRIEERQRVAVVGGVANNRAVLKYLRDYCASDSLEVFVPDGHEYLLALGAAQTGDMIKTADLDFAGILNREYVPEQPLPPLDPGRVNYMPDLVRSPDLETSLVYLGVDCGSVSTKCVLLDHAGRVIGGVYLPTAGRPALQVLELMKRVRAEYADLVEDSRIIACTTGSGRFLSQKILNAEYAVDEITCQAEGVKYLYGSEGTLSIIEIGGEDSKFLQLSDGALYDYNMNPVCAAGTGTFLENLAGLLDVKIKDEFSERAFEAEYAIDLGDTCTLLSQSALASAASQGLPFPSQIASLAYSAARNYLSKTGENRPMEGKVVFTGATAKNWALAAAFAAEIDKEISVPPSPELSGALGSALMAMKMNELGLEAEYSFRNLDRLNDFTQAKHKCRAKCEHDHNCTLDVITFADGSKFLYGDRCGRYSGLEKKRATQYAHLPDYVSLRNEVFYDLVKEPPQADGPTVGIAKSGLFFDLYPFWSTFFRKIGASVSLSADTSEKTLEEGKKHLDSEMCYPMEVLIGHYSELADSDADYIFVPDVVTMEPLPWAKEWPRSWGCPLLQTLRGTVTSALDLPPGRILYAQLNYRQGKLMITNQLRDAARRIMGERFTERRLREAVEAAYAAQEEMNLALERHSVKVMEELPTYVSDDTIIGVFLGRPYTIYDREVSKGSLEYARQRGVIAVPQDFLLAYVRGWYEGRIDSKILGSRREFEEDFQHLRENVDNIYPVQLQRMLAAAHAVQYLNRRAADHGLPTMYTILQDPFKCGPNAMLRHYLRSVSSSLRLTMDEHTAPAGMITRLEAFRNTCLARRRYTPPTLISARTLPINRLRDKKILIPEPSHHGRVFAAVLQNAGVDADTLPRSRDRDLTLARRYVNGDECLPMIQNVQDFLEYAQNPDEDLDRVVFFQGWACGPCRYGLYAPTQSLLLNQAGLGERMIYAGELFEMIRQFGLGFAVGMFDGSLAVDMLYKMLHATRPYELEAGSSEALFEKYSDALMDLLRTASFGTAAVLAGRHLRPFEQLIREAADAFSEIPRSHERRPRIIVAGEFYVRLDDRSNQDIIRKIERAGGEANLSPASELFAYTGYINFEEARTLFRQSRNLGALAQQAGYAGLNMLAHREETRIAAAAESLLPDGHEPTPAQLREHAQRYISEHYGGEPPMTVGRTSALAKRGSAEGAVLVAPFTCMPGSVVEAQLSVLRRDLDIPIVATYYDGKNNPSREELIQGLVFQAKQRLQHRLGDALPRSAG
ncbi:MAG: acyl-CoA dehydratase activase [Bacillota bacterium]